MSRTDLDAATLAKTLRRMAGDGSMEWVCEPMQTSVLLDVADALDENAKLRELVRDMVDWAYISDYCDLEEQFADRMRELGVEV